MIVLTTPVNVPNVTRIQATDVALFDSSSQGIVALQVRSPAASNRVQGYQLTINDSGQCSRIKVNPTPIAFGDPVVIDQFTPSPGAYTRLEAAYRGGGSKAAAFKAVETQLLADGIIDASLTGTVQ